MSSSDLGYVAGVMRRFGAQGQERAAEQKRKENRYELEETNNSGGGSRNAIHGDRGIRPGKGRYGKAEPGEVLLRFMKDSTVGGSCNAIVGDIQQSMLNIEGVKNVKIDAKGVQVTFDPRETTPERIVTAFNKENPDTLLQLSNTKANKVTP